MLLIRKSRMVRKITLAISVSTNAHTRSSYETLESFLPKSTLHRTEISLRLSPNFVSWSNLRRELSVWSTFPGNTTNEDFFFGENPCEPCEKRAKTELKRKSSFLLHLRSLFLIVVLAFTDWPLSRSVAKRGWNDEVWELPRGPRQKFISEMLPRHVRCHFGSDSLR